jgi:hypothetical protein
MKMATVLVSDRSDGFSIFFKFDWHFGNYIFPFPLSPAKLIGNVLPNNVLLYTANIQKPAQTIAIGTFLRLMVELAMLH